MYVIKVSLFDGRESPESVLFIVLYTLIATICRHSVKRLMSIDGDSGLRLSSSRLEQSRRGI